MHDYSIDKHPKEKILFALAFLSITAAPWINRAISSLVSTFGNATGLWSSPIVTAIPIFTLFLFVYWLFNTKLWKVKWLRRLLLVPDLNGVWACEGSSILRRMEKVDHPWNGKMRITQSWTTMLVHLQTGQSSSSSVAASICHVPGVGYRLLYNYVNDPRPDQTELQRHDGSAEVLFVENCLSGEGHYFTDQHRSTVGTIKLSKV